MLCALCMIVVNASSSLSYCIDREDQDVRGRRMDFYTVLDQVLALLRQRGRVSYRALKRQFQLDDETLADLTAELLYAHHPGGEEGSGLVRLGDTSTAPEAPMLIPQPETSQSAPPPMTPPPGAVATVARDSAHCVQRPPMVGPSGRHHGCARPLPLRCARAMGGLGNR